MKALLERLKVLWRKRMFRRAFWSLVLGSWLASLLGGVGASRCRADWVLTFGKEAPAGVCGVEWGEVAVASIFTGLAVFALWGGISGIRHRGEE